MFTCITPQLNIYICVFAFVCCPSISVNLFLAAIEILSFLNGLKEIFRSLHRNIVGIIF